MKTSVNFEYTISRLVKNLTSQGRFIEAEYTARKYLNLLKLYHNRNANYPLLMHQLSEALLEQNRFDEALWASHRSLLGHKNICSQTDGLPYTEARKTSTRILAALGSK